MLQTLRATPVPLARAILYHAKATQFSKFLVKWAASLPRWRTFMLDGAQPHPEEELRMRKRDKSIVAIISSPRYCGLEPILNQTPGFKPA
jgi:hypothetical protein